MAHIDDLHRQAADARVVAEARRESRRVRRRPRFALRVLAVRRHAGPATLAEC